MKKEYRDKFGNFVHEERKKEEETLAICEDILKNSRNEMAVAMRFLQSAFGALKQVRWELTENFCMQPRDG